MEGLQGIEHDHDNHFENEKDSSEGSSPLSLVGAAAPSAGSLWLFPTECGPTRAPADHGGLSCQDQSLPLPVRRFFP